MISHPEVTAVIVSTPEQRAHRADPHGAASSASRCWWRSRSASRCSDADTSSIRLRATKGDLRVGYSRRYKECFLRAKEQMLHGRLGQVVGGTARVYNSRAQTFAILKRDPHATPVLDVLTYYVDLMCWFLEGNRPVEVVARGQHGIFKEAGYGAHDVTWAIVTFADGAVINFGVSYALPARYPTLGQSDRVELLGTEGTMIIDDDHMDHLLFSEKGIPHAYVPGSRRQHGVPRQQHGGRLGGRRFLGPARQRDPRLARSSRDRRADRPHHAGAGAHQPGNHHRHRARGGVRPIGAAAACSRRTSDLRSGCDGAHPCATPARCAAPRWQFAPARRTRAGRPPPARRPPGGFPRARDWRSRAASGSCCSSCRSTIPAPD